MPRNVCLQQTTTDSIVCDCCKAWRRRKCVKWFKSDLARLSATSASWSCLLCTIFPRFAYIFSDLEILKAQNGNLHTSLCIVTHIVAALRNEFDAQNDNFHEVTEEFGTCYL